MMLLPEIVTVGIYNSNIAAKNTVISKKRKTSMFEIELPIEDGGISYINSSSKQIKPNMIICAKPGQVRHTRFPFKCYYVHMIIHSGTLYDALMDAPDFFEIDKSETYEEIFIKLVKHYNTLSDSKEIILQSLILELIYTITRDSTKRIKNGNSNNTYTLIEKSLKYIKENLTENLTLENVAKAMSISPIHFHNTFKTAVGKTLRDYIEEQRIKRATNLLLTTNFSLTQIAYDCGFSSQSYFSYVFKRKMKVTPREYVREIYNKYEI
ncbi:MAG: AraC family transcriptional regulator [Ruminococcaceae bacterium]|nr:AraC family transcriptional regulator [Oscillospiraceae bacterium]